MKQNITKNILDIVTTTTQILSPSGNSKLKSKYIKLTPYIKPTKSISLPHKIYRKKTKQNNYTHTNSQYKPNISKSKLKEESLNQKNIYFKSHNSYKNTTSNKLSTNKTKPPKTIQTKMTRYKHNNISYINKLKSNKPNTLPSHMNTPKPKIKISKLDHTHIHMHKEKNNNNSTTHRLFTQTLVKTKLVHSFTLLSHTKL